VWGDHDVHDLTPMSKRPIERSFLTDPQKTVFLKINYFEKYFANKVNKTLDPVTLDKETHNARG